MAQPPIIQLRISDQDPYLYQQPTASGSLAIGTDNSDSSKLKIVTSNAIDNVDPSSGTIAAGSCSMSIDPSTNGNIEFCPQGSGQTNFARGSVAIEGQSSTAGNLLMNKTPAGGLSGVIEFGGTRFISNPGTANNFIGEGAGNLGVTGHYNTAVGFTALPAVTSGSTNTAVGGSSLMVSTTDSNNTALGYATLAACNGGSNNTMVGSGVGIDITTGANNTGIGEAALSLLTSGAHNTVVGDNALFSGLTASNNIVIGSSAASAYIAAEGSNIVIGNAGVVSESNQIRIGTQGSGAGQQNACNIAGIVGNTVSSPSVVTIDSSGNMGSAAFPASGVTSSAVNNTAAGTGALVNVTVGVGNFNTAFGFDAANQITTGLRNTAFGASALASSSSNNNNTAIGYNTLNAISGVNNTAVGASALSVATSGDQNTAIGYNALASNNNASGIVAIGANALAVSTSDSNNTAVGTNVLGVLNGGNNNTALGAGALASSTADSNNTAIGSQALTQINGGTNNTAVGYNTLQSSTADSNNTAIGYNALTAINGGAANTCIGYVAGNGIVTGSSCVAIGDRAMQSGTPGNDNVAIGRQALVHTQDGSSVAIGSGALYSYTTAGIGPNIGIGVNTGGSLTTGGRNCLVGNSSCDGLITGSYNTAFGDESGINFTTSESSNISIGFQVGTVGDNNVLRIGTSGVGAGQQSSCFIAGITGVGIVGTPVLVSAAGQLGVAVSSARFKQDIQDMDRDSSLIHNLRPVTFSYKIDQNKAKQFGLIAEEVLQVMPQMVTYDLEGNIQSVKYQDLVPMLLNEMIKLKAEVGVLKETLDKNKSAVVM